MNSKQLNIVMGVIILILLAVIGYVVFLQKNGTSNEIQDNTSSLSNNNNIDDTANKNSDPAPKSVQNTSISADWKTYTNTNLGFSLKYPQSNPVSKELNDEYNRLTLFKGSSKNYFEVRLLEEGQNAGINSGYLDAPVVDRNIKLGGLTGYKALSETGYGDAGFQGDPYVDFGVRKGVNMYHLIFYGDAKISAEEQAVIDSFKFTN